MQTFILENYLWIQALHIIAVIAWMAGLLYLPRLFVYHAGSGHGSETADTLTLMEERLLKIIMNPAMIASWVFGLMMLYANPVLLNEGWMHLKLTCVVLLTGVHHVFARWRKKFERGENQKTAGFFRVVNEVPTALMIIIVLMAVVKPF